MEKFHSTYLCTGLLAVLASGCASLDRVGPPSGSAPLSSVQALPAAIDSRVYQRELGNMQMGPLQRTRRNDGYTVESGALTDHKGAATGSLIAVRSPTGAVTAVIDRPGRRGLLLVDVQGTRRFLEEPAYDYLKADEVAGAPPGDPPAVQRPAADAFVIDALVAFSVKALDSLGSDPIAFALAQLETVNVGLRNSQIWSTRVDLAGIVVTDTDRGVDSEGLRQTDQDLGGRRRAYRHDINVAYGKQGPYAGLAYAPGLSSINSIDYPLAFRHELGHNVGGHHCYPDGGDDYRHGHQLASGMGTHLCGNNLPFYSNPRVSLEGVPVGNGATADMARLWREQASRLVDAGPAFGGDRMIMLSSQGEARLNVVTMPTSSSAGVVALSSREGPVELTANAGSYTMLRTIARDENGRPYIANLRAQKQVGECSRTGMNSNRGCNPLYDRGGFSLFVSYDVEDNAHLPPSWFNSVLELKAVDAKFPEWSRPILISFSIHR
ncbi:hypothetical protein [Pseudomonas sp. UBA6562]|uniref:hypothetical protein n=1 Tax=Pseudomonas sp. UBA6562 TaxID=1947332 RepID=UPI0025E0192C|nr:hypothetical protein [Pseudomonas sp. UBA6562]